MKVICLDLEGVLVPEIWIAFAEHTGIEELRMTTRDISDYDELMSKRLEILKDNSFTIADIQSVISTLQPFPGAKKLLAWIRERFQLVILSDTFYEFSAPLMAQLDFPTILCHTLNINEEGFISNYKLRQQDAKKRAVEGFQAMNFKVLAAGDSHNDIGMLSTADYGFFINAPDVIRKQHPDIQSVNGFDELKRGISQVDSEIGSAE